MRARIGSRVRPGGGSAYFRTTLAAVAAVAAAVVVPAGAAWDGTQKVRMGDSVEADLAGTEMHQFAFFVPEGTKITAKVKPVKGTDLVPDLALVDATLGKVDTGAKTTEMKNFVVPGRGAFALQVRAGAGTGGYVLTTKAKFPEKIGVKGATALEFDFAAPAGTLVKAKVKPSKNSAALPVMTAFEGPTGDVAGFAESTSFKKLTLPTDGTYLVTLRNDGTAGAPFDWEVQLTPPKAGRAWYMGVADDPRGIESRIREQWLSSGHADVTAEAFRHWDHDIPALVPESCGRCHVGSGYEDYLGSDGSTVNKVDFKHEPTRTVDCETCHNSKTIGLTEVTFTATGTETFTDTDGNGKWGTDETYTDSNKNGKYDPAEAFTDENGSGVYETGEPYTDANTNGKWDASEPYTDANGNGRRDKAETFVDKNGNAKYDAAKTVTGLGDESRCMVCHQGRESKKTVDDMITAAKVSDVDTVDKLTATSTPSDGDGAITFRNIHYFAAAATLYGREAGVAYEYPDLGYEKKFTHVAGYDACHKCHNQHTLKLRVDECIDCHEIAPANATNPALYELAIEELRRVRMASTVSDYDGDGDAEEGVYYELVGMSEMLYRGIQEYGRDVLGKPIIYDSHTYPYWFEDKGVIGVVEPGIDTGYTDWTARLVKAAYNYQYWQKDPGAFAHNAKYLMEVMYDSLADLDAHPLVDVSAANGYPVDFGALVRNDLGHFDTSADAYRDWSDDTGISSSCARCHSVEGFEFRQKYGIDVTVAQPTIAGMSCESCHETGADFKTDPKRVLFTRVEFPTPSTATSAQKNAVAITGSSAAAPDDSYVCMQCHMGRQSMLTIDTYIAGQTAGSKSLQFQNVHYFPAGAVQYGKNAAVGYQFTGKTYAGPWTHDVFTPYPPNWIGVPANGQVASQMYDHGRCAYCHMDEGTHSFEPELSAKCRDCHTGNIPNVEFLRADRPLDYDGDGNVTEPIKDEVEAVAALLYAQMRTYSKANFTAGSDVNALIYDSHSNPYFFKDKNGNGVFDPAEEYVDTNGNGSYTAAEAFVDADADGAYDAGESFTDTNSNEKWDPAEPFTDADGDLLYDANDSGSSNRFLMDATLVKAAHNYQIFQKEPGAWAHNTNYVLQLLIDSIEALGGDVSALKRP